ncbi:MAG TPA: M20/M25/M40 family metallo-hydrolase [Gemmatimonadales bacterium]|nr:M20/M25/M40 family metallo-hydrolase [Gemmatimonadales bacterium]
MIFGAWSGAASALAAQRPAASVTLPASILPAPSERAMEAHLRFLASDLLEGRAPATRGGHLATAYIAAQFEALGLEPAGVDGSYYQPVALAGTLTQQPSFVWGRGADTRSLKPGDEFVAWAMQPDPRITVDGDVVFVGYGIKAPEWRWDDYKGVDLHGKILLMLVNDPGIQDSTMFKGAVLTYYGRWTYKLEEAARQGALGVVLIHTNQSATYGWDVVRGSWSVEQFQLDGATGPGLTFASWASHDAVQAALQSVGMSLDSLTRAAARRDFVPVATGLHAALDLASAVRHVPSENVVARLRGSDPALSSQVVVISAHWDHKGIGPAVNGDSIYNGAEDNASGVAAMLATAEALSRMPRRPKRSVLFIATTAEESGLLGSAGYVAHPLVPIAQTAADINLDEVNVRGATRDIGALGNDQSTLGTLFANAAAAESLRVANSPDVGGGFFRSDHFPFAKAGVPSLSIQPGLDFVGKPAGWGKEQADEFEQHRYHQPSDEWTPLFRYDGMSQEVRVVMRLALAIADAPGMPEWLPGADFKRH